MFEDIKRNLEQEKRIIQEARAIRRALLQEEEKKKFYTESINSLLRQINLLNKTIPELLKEWSPLNKTVQAISPKNTKTPEQIVKISYISPTTKEKRYITLNKKDKKAYLLQLKLSEENVSNVKKIDFLSGKTIVKKPNPYARISNKLFRKHSEKMVPLFSSLASDLKKGNVRFLLSTYLSMALFSAFLGFITGLAIFISLIIVNFEYLIHAWIPIALPILILIMFYIYPAGESNSVQKKISQELPFATIHMATIAGSDIEPTKIFKIIAASKEYQNIGIEIRKVIAQVDIYGYDLVTSLKNVSKWTPNKKLAELFSGLATNIHTGGELKNYLEKKAENFLLDYKLERKKYIELAGTFMDIYISILIAAPLILMMMFIVMNVAGLGIGGFGITTLMVLSVAVIIVVNILFIVVLNVKQPKV